jgi:Domain of unknown function (DUF4145)
VGNMTADGDLTGLSRCPHCQIANPQMVRLWISETLPKPDKPMVGNAWAVFKCTTCTGVVLAKCRDATRTHVGHPFATNFAVVATFPQPLVVDEALPESARIYLTQALQSLHAPDAAALMAASAVDAMLKEKKFDKGSLYDRINAAVEAHVLTDGMGSWAHAVRLEANNVRHADKQNPHCSTAEAEQVVEFAKALGDFLYVLTAKIDKGVKAAQQAPAA